MLIGLRVISISLLGALFLVHFLYLDRRLKVSGSGYYSMGLGLLFLREIIILFMMPQDPTPMKAMSYLMYISAWVSMFIGASVFVKKLISFKIPGA